LNSAGKIVANYWLEHVYTPEIGAPHREGDYHIHDLDMFAGYCAGWSLKDLLQQGFNGVPGAIAAGPAQLAFIVAASSGREDSRPRALGSWIIDG